MTQIKRPAIKIAGASLLAPLAVLMQVLPPIFLTPWFMRIDIVAVPWILCWIIFGLKTSLLCLLISAPLVGLLGPFAGGLVGMVMKSVASVWMFAIPAVFAYKLGGARGLLEKKSLYIIAGLCAIIIRVLVTLVFNLYFALPTFFPFLFPKGPEDVLTFYSLPPFQSFASKSLSLIGVWAYIAEISFWNIVQGIIDLSVASALGLIVLRRLAIKK